MIRTLRESKARLSELVELAGRGQEVLITVRGRVKARLSAVENDQLSDKRVAWAKELRSLHRACGMRKHKTGTADVLTSIREGITGVIQKPLHVAR